ncbi:PIN-like domain-containing protein [Roseivirga sp. BDSF3-8]|uniref:PIN-like domain-containing protein n=1 Tax=Roseivirga sp. BDSF3-8 TaxID=3241598 RepID=UPI0035327FA5
MDLSLKNYSKFQMPEQKEIKLWKEAYFIFDSSSLLNIYHIPISYIHEIEKIFKCISDRAWIPGHVEFEYLKNREHVLQEPIKKYDSIIEKLKNLNSIVEKEFKTTISNIIKETKNENKHPFIPSQSFNKLVDVIEKFKQDVESLSEPIYSEVESQTRAINDLLADDSYFKILQETFEVGQNYSFKKQLEIVKEGQYRYNNQIPPGYGDKNKKSGIQKYADLIIWKQILDFAKETNKPIILIIDDISKKDDWCHIDNRKRITHPNNDLIKEFMDYSEKDFWMYTLSDFIYKSQKHLATEIDITTIDDMVSNLYYSDNYIVYDCNSCKKRDIMTFDDISENLDLTDSQERGMGYETHYEYVVGFICEHCNNSLNINIEVVEYPEGNIDYIECRLEGGNTVREYFNIELRKEKEPEMCELCGEYPQYNGLPTCFNCDEKTAKADFD